MSERTRAAIAEAHLGLRRVHVNVDLVRRQRNEQRKQRVTPARNEVAVGGAHGADAAACPSPGGR